MRFPVGYDFQHKFGPVPAINEIKGISPRCRAIEVIIQGIISLFQYYLLRSFTVDSFVVIHQHGLTGKSLIEIRFEIGALPYSENVISENHAPYVGDVGIVKFRRDKIIFPVILYGKGFYPRGSEIRFFRYLEQIETDLVGIAVNIGKANRHFGQTFLNRAIITFVGKN